jgi:uncharacterized integral membrane protein (TIGR00698 family)
MPQFSAALALGLGAALALSLGNPNPQRSGSWAGILLSLALVGLGAGMDLSLVAEVGGQGLLRTAASIAAVWFLGRWLARRLRVEAELSVLVIAGTAICGGSAIAALAPIVRARSDRISIALGTVFVLNAIGLLLFPHIGRALHLDPESFGLWCALAIHDTSSVVAAAAQFGESSLAIATAAKLSRALWIVPIAFVLCARSDAVHAQDTSVARRVRVPWFIVGFVAAAVLFSSVPALADSGAELSRLARRAFSPILFLIGVGLSRETLRALGWRPLLLGLLLWLALAGASLLSIL